MSNDGLLDLDETPLHQGPVTFEHALTSDHRFFDRVVFGCFHPEAEFELIVGMGSYKNMNVMDGFAMLITHSEKQYNVRYSRPLRPNIAERVLGSLRIDIIEPFKKIRLSQGPGEHGFSFDLMWEAVLPAHMEGHHFGRLDGRIHQDYMRYSQFGEVSGWLEVKGERVDASKWFGWRDHSWGVRPNVGGFEPFTGTRYEGGIPSAARAKGKGMLLMYLGFWTGEEGGGIQLIEDGDGERIYTDGSVSWPEAAGKKTQKVVEASNDITLVENTRVFQRMDINFRLADGSLWQASAEAIGRGMVYKGSGYDGGYNDGKGLGVYRSDTLLIEHDIYDVTHPENVVMPDGSVIQPRQREQVAKVTINGKHCFGYCPFYVVGHHARFEKK